MSQVAVHTEGGGPKGRGLHYLSPASLRDATPCTTPTVSQPCRSRSWGGPGSAQPRDVKCARGRGSPQAGRAWPSLAGSGAPEQSCGPGLLPWDGAGSALTPGLDPDKGLIPGRAGRAQEEGRVELHLGASGRAQGVPGGGWCLLPGVRLILGRREGGQRNCPQAWGLL